MNVPMIGVGFMVVAGLAGAVRAATDCHTNTTYFGWAGCQPILEDYDGDGLDDLAMYETDTATWYIGQSAHDTLLTVPWGVPSGVPVEGDYDGDGRADLAVYQPSTGRWWIHSLGAGAALMNGEAWGARGSVPVPADYDGDGADDLAVYDVSALKWYVYSLRQRTLLLDGLPWGADGVSPVPADYDGDGFADPALYHESSGLWGLLLSGSGYQPVLLSFGGPGYAPAQADYDGDQRADLAVYSAAAGTYYIHVADEAAVLEFHVPAGSVPCPGRFYLPDVYAMAVFQTNIVAAPEILGYRVGTFHVMVPDATSALGAGVLDNFQAVSTVLGPFASATTIFANGLSILQAVGAISSPSQQILDKLNQMDHKLDEIITKLGVLDKKMDFLQQLIELKFEEVQREIKWQPLSDKITTILAAHNALRAMASTNYVASYSFEVRQLAVLALLARLERDNIQSVTEQLAVNLMAEVESSGRGFLDIYTDYLINNHLRRGKNPLYCYLNLEYMFGRVLAHEYKGAQLTMEYLERTSGAGSAVQWRDRTFLGGQYGLAAQMDKFHECVHRIVDGETDTGLYVVCPETNRPFLPADALEIYSRANFIAAYCSTGYSHGLTGRLIGEPGRIADYGRQNQVRANQAAVPLLRPLSRTVPAMRTPYVSGAEWLVYAEAAPNTYQVSATNRLACDIFALPQAAAGTYALTVAGAREQESPQTVTVLWRSNDYVTVVQPGTSNAVPYGYFIVPVRHAVGQHPANLTLPAPTIRYGADQPTDTHLMQCAFADSRTISNLYHEVYILARRGLGGNWEHSLAMYLPRSAALDARVVGLYGHARMEWKGAAWPSCRVYHALGLGSDLQNQIAMKDILYTAEESSSWHAYQGEGVITGAMTSGAAYLPVFSSSRGHARIPRVKDITQKVWTDRVSLFLP